MYCSSCGMAVTPGLSYCNHCGAKLGGAKGDGITKSPEVKPETLVAAIAAVFIFGLGAIIFLMMALKMVFGPENLALVIAFTFLSFLIMLAVEGVFVGMLLGRKKGAKEVGDTERLKKQTAKELSEAKARMLPEPAMSVTEHTTRTLEPVDRKHKTE
jgi:Na+-transporting methylmalonyl-CoA/oxaloacetate decarboxylase gamma subunit